MKDPFEDFELYPLSLRVSKRNSVLVEIDLIHAYTQATVINRIMS